MTRLAAVDLGTNTARLLVGEAEPSGGLRPVWSEQMVVRLGQGLGRSGHLESQAMARALGAVRSYRDRARVLGATVTLVAATAAVRDAGNGREFLGRLQDEPDVRARVLSGDDEAGLTLLGVAWGLRGLATRFGLVDVGGGSTEMVVADGMRPLVTRRVSLGVVALAERFFRSDPVDPRECAACVAHIEERLAAEVWPDLRAGTVDLLVATAGTATTLAALDLGLEAYDPGRVHGHVLARTRIEAHSRRLGALPHAARAALPCLEPGRADLIVPGTAILLAVLRGLSLDSVLVSETGLREGILLEAFGWRPETGSQGPFDPAAGCPPTGSPSAC
jgi:exopolyphosphatase/guanosine-5'-triphosphate,3'-diphosphate pyrophosphatase